MDEKNKYDDIIGLPHHTSEKHGRMSNYDRAAQFSPFAALTGHSDALSETARLTDAKAELDESEKEAVNRKLQMIMNTAHGQIETAVTYFVPDGKKKGGAYLKHIGYLKKFDSFSREITMTDGTVIPVDDISDIEILTEN